MSSDASEQSQYLEAFPAWLAMLGEDVRALTTIASSRPEQDSVVERLALGLDYVLRSVRILADGTEELSYLDDAFVLRVAARHALHSCESADAEETLRDGVLGRLAQEAELVASFLGEGDYEKLTARVERFEPSDPSRSVVEDALAWASAYGAPAFKAETRSLIRLRAFVAARLAS